MFLGKQGIQLKLLLTTISLAACIPNLAIAADTQTSESGKSVTTTVIPSTPATTTTISTTPSVAPAPDTNTTIPSSTSGTTMTSPTTSTNTNTNPNTNSSTTSNSNNSIAPAASTSKAAAPTTPTASASSAAPAASATSTTSTTSVTTTTSTTTPDASKKEIQVTAAEKQKAIVDFLKKAAEYIKENGKESSLAEFNKKNGIFSKDSLYVFAVNYDGLILATLDFDQKFLGTNQLNYKDPDGLSVIQRLIEKAKSGGGWLLYKTENPATKTMECKYSYVMPGNIAGSSDYLIGTGYYYAINPKTNKCDPEK
jgi:cytochrome c